LNGSGGWVVQRYRADAPSNHCPSECIVLEKQPRPRVELGAGWGLWPDWIRLRAGRRIGPALRQQP